MDSLKATQENSITKPYSKVDARIVSLYSQEILPESSINNRNAIGNNKYYCFSYYDKIEISPVEVKTGSILKDSYNSIYITPETNKQSIMAFTDIVSDKKPDNFGHTVKEINDFWSIDDSSILFITMVNLVNVDDLDSVLKQINNIFPNGSYLTYLTFDHCNVIIFCHEKSFKEYTKIAFRLYYDGRIVPADIITLYSLPKLSSYYDDGETFEATINVGVRNYTEFEKLYKEIEDIGKPIEKRWLLGRNDCSIYCSVATVKWLMDVREKFDSAQCDSLERCYQTYSIITSVCTKDVEIDISTEIKAVNKYGYLRDTMKESYYEFVKKYTSANNCMKFPVDEVWLRWLRQSSELAVSLLENPLSEDLGTCLVPQFLDLFIYGKRFWEKLEGDYQFQQTDEERNAITLKNRDCIEMIVKSYSIFFSNIAILIDSMNQANREFIQIPPFHLPSFHVPPKIMEFFIAIAYKLKQLFQDDKDTYYGLLIAPKLIHSLGVQSIANQDVLKDDQWLEIVISESSFYTIQLTTQTLAHEISHFIGQKNRHRVERKEYVIKCAYCNLITDILEQIPELAADKFAYPECKKHIATISFSLSDLLKIVDLIYEARCESIDSHLEESETRMVFLEKIVYELSSDILITPELYRLFSDKLYELANKSIADSRNISIIDYLTQQYKWCVGLTDKEQDLNNNYFLKSVVTDLFDEIIYSCLELYSFDYTIEDIKGTCSVTSEFAEMCDRYNHVLYFFSETFADLQAILVFDLSWSQYCNLMKPSDEVEIVADCPQRMLAVAKVMIKNKRWSLDSICSSNIKEFEQLQRAIKLDVQEDAYDLAELSFDAILTYYLVDYLDRCYATINAQLSDKDNLIIVNELRNIHQALSDDTSILNVQKKIGKFVEDFRKTL